MSNTRATAMAGQHIQHAVPSRQRTFEIDIRRSGNARRRGPSPTSSARTSALPKAQT